MGKRYPALQTISFLFKLVAIVIILAGVFHLIFVMFNSIEIVTYRVNSLPEWLSTLPFALIPLFSSLLLALILWAFSELIICLVDIEYNTRQTSNQIQPIEQTQSDKISEKHDYIDEDLPIRARQPKNNKPLKPKVIRSFSIKATLKNIFNKKLW